MCLRFHPARNDGLCVGESESDVFRQPAKVVSDVPGPVAQGWQARAWEHVSHLLKARHVLRLDLGHLIELVVVDQVRQALMSPLGVDESEDARLGRSEFTSTQGSR